MLAEGRLRRLHVSAVEVGEIAHADMHVRKVCTGAGRGKYIIMYLYIARRCAVRISVVEALHRAARSSFECFVAHQSRTKPNTPVSRGLP